MGNANISKQLKIQTTNKVGMFEEVTSVITDAGANITTFCAYGEGNNAVFYAITTNNDKAKQALAQKGLSVSEDEVVTLMLEDKVGAAKEIATKIKNAGINLDYVYGTTCGCAPSKALMVIASKDNNKVIAAIQG